MHQHAARMPESDSRLDAAVGKIHERDALQWHADRGIGYFPADVKVSPYDQAYFDRFARQALDPIGRRLMAGRIDFVERHCPRSLLLDVGIGSGAFIAMRNKAYRRPLTLGYDVNPAGARWLRERGLWLDPYATAFPVMSLWDVLEHIKDFRPLLKQCRAWLFLSLPIFRDLDHVRGSKHFRPLEHYWYFTRNGLVAKMAECGFALAAESDMEIAAGREDIGAFAFRRSK